MNRREWFHDGPLLKVEFTRQSMDGRLTLVLTENAMAIRTLWTLMATSELETARKSLRIREGINQNNAARLIGTYVVQNEPASELENVLRLWSKDKQIDAIIWTNLLPKFGDEDNRIPTITEALNYLRLSVPRF